MNTATRIRCGIYACVKGPVEFAGSASATQYCPSLRQYIALKLDDRRITFIAQNVIREMKAQFGTRWGNG